MNVNFEPWTPGIVLLPLTIPGVLKRDAVKNVLADFVRLGGT